MEQLPVWIPAEGHKPKLARNFAWVVGVELLSKRFAHVPQYDNLQIWFNDHPTDYRERLDEIIRRQIPYQILTVWYSTMGNPHWFFMVYPVESKKRSKIRALLEASAFPIVDDWMCKEKPETWLMTQKHLRCIYYQNEMRIEVNEEGG